MEALFRQVGIYSSVGQNVRAGRYGHASLLQGGEERTDSGRRNYRSRIDVLEFIAAGTAYANHGINTIPFFIYYSMFGFQRIGDLIWAAADMRCRGFLVGGTAGRTTLAGEGLQHQDGHSHVLALSGSQLAGLRSGIRL
jgi:pyruvate dehydrogenase E1 component